MKSLQNTLRDWVKDDQIVVNPENLVKTFLNYAQETNKVFQHSGAFQDSAGKFNLVINNLLLLIIFILRIS